MNFRSCADKVKFSINLSMAVGILPLAIFAAGCGDSESALDAAGAAGGMYDGLIAANAMYDVEGNRAFQRDEPPIVTRAHLDRIQLGMSEQEVEDIVGAPPTARVEQMNAATGLGLVTAQWLNGDLSEATFKFGANKLSGVSQSGIQ